MREYEAVFVFRAEDELFKQGKTLVQEAFANAKVEVQKEEDMGSRELAYSVGTETRGHYYFYGIQADPQSIVELSQATKLMDPVLKHLFVRPE